MSVRREKYEKAKNQSRALKNMLDEAEVNKTEKLFEIATLQEELDIKNEENKKLEQEVERWKSLSERLPDDGDMEDLRRTNRKQNKLIDTLEKQITKLESGKDMLLFQIKTLEDTRNDLKSQLIEVKQENRELKRLEPIKKEN
jgi:chromosome segregation ATPase